MNKTLYFCVRCEQSFDDMEDMKIIGDLQDGICEHCAYVIVQNEFLHLRDVQKKKVSSPDGRTTTN